MDSSADTAGDAFDEMPLKKPRLDERSELPPPASLWTDIHPDILGVVLRFLPCAADRARVRFVCPRWRAAASQALPPPLPLLVLPKFELSCCTSGEALVPDEVAADEVRYVGSYDGWVVGVTQIHREYLSHVDGELLNSGHYSEMDDKCFLVNAFSHRVVHLPRLCRESYICAHLSLVLQDSPCRQWHKSCPF